jgi:1-acyl-sn-glycerol-3-phosphate acyltransferase/nucleoside-diphosphate-sugar epimerase
MSIAQDLNTLAPATLHRESRASPMAKTAIIGADNNEWATCVFNALRQRPAGSECYFAELRRFSRDADRNPLVADCVYVPTFADGNGLTPDLFEAENLFRALAKLRGFKFVLLSSALIYGTGPGRPGFATEEYSCPGNGGNSIGDHWSALERYAQHYLAGNVRLIVLRPVAVVPSPTLFSRTLLSSLAPTLPGHDPNMQVLSLGDLAEAIACALERDAVGTLNIAPQSVVPLHAAVRAAGGHRLPIPRTLRRLTKPSVALDFLRYSWTVSTDKAEKELGFVCRHSSVGAFLKLRKGTSTVSAPEIQFDAFGMDKNYIRFYGKTLFKFLCDFYWRIEDKGLEHVPPEGRGVLVGMHRGFMPWDGVMALHLLVKKTGRYPRFLTHPALLKFPFLANFMTKLGGVVACQQSADRILESNELLGIFPEGIQGAFTSYRQAYQLQEFGRDAFVKIALRNRAPIVPFVTVGSAETFPIFGKIKSRLWTRYTEWPCVPLTPTFPLFPVPLPSKWHTQFLAPLHIEKKYPPETARNGSIVKAISLEVRTRMQQAVNEILGRRRSVFLGSIFEPEARE